MEKNEWYKVREIAYSALIGSHLDPKKLPKTKEKFMPLDGKKGLTDKQVAAIKAAQEQYKKDLEKNGNKRVKRKDRGRSGRT